MRNLVKYTVLACWLWACGPDNNDTKASAESAAAESRASGQPHQSDGWQTQFSLPADMTDQAVQAGHPPNNMYRLLTRRARKR